MFLLMTYVNRSFFVVSPEAEPISISGEARGEINSLIELFQWVFYGYENGIDEDGDSPESYNFAKIHKPPVDHNLLFNFELTQPLISERCNLFPQTERILALPVYGTIDHPPERA